MLSAPASEKIFDQEQPRYLEDEGFYVGTPPPVPGRNIHKLENRLLKQADKVCGVCCSCIADLLHVKTKSIKSFLSYSEIFNLSECVSKSPLIKVKKTRLVLKCSCISSYCCITFRADNGLGRMVA